jgi:hypothetical protein
MSIPGGKLLRTNCSLPVSCQDRGEVVNPHIDESITPRKKAPRTFSTGIRAGIMNEYGQRSVRKWVAWTQSSTAMSMSKGGLLITPDDGLYKSLAALFTEGRALRTSTARPAKMGRPFTGNKEGIEFRGNRRSKIEWMVSQTGPGDSRREIDAECRRRPPVVPTHIKAP